MAWDASIRRRWFGALALLAALAMLAAGETVLKDRLNDVALLLYWLVCLAFTLLAILLAFRDFRVVQDRLRREQRDLFAGTLKEIEADVRHKPRQGGRNASGQ